MSPTIRDCDGRSNATADFLSLDDPSPSCRRKLTTTTPITTYYEDDVPREVSYQIARIPPSVTEAENFGSIYVQTTRRHRVVRNPTKYLGKFNAKPYENSVQDSNCNSYFNPNMATCGLAVDDKGEFILLSQGFCCDCTQCRQDGNCTVNQRGNACSSRTTKTAACLRMTEIYYDGYSIEDTPQTAYELDVRVWGDMADFITDRIYTTRPINTSVTLSPDSPQQYNATDEIIVMFLNHTVDTSLGSVKPITNITTKYVFMPVTPVNDERVRAGSAEWLFLDPSSVTVDGSECNKVGTSYRAFALQLDGCQYNVGTCLSSQLEDLRIADLTVMGMGILGSFLGSNYGNFTAQTGSNGTKYIAYPGNFTPSVTYAQVVLNADQLVPYAFAISGTLTRVALTATANAHIPLSKQGEYRTTADYDATSGRVFGAIAVTARNNADYSSSLYVVPSDCSDAIDSEALYGLWITFNGYETNTANLFLRSKPHAWVGSRVSCEFSVYNSAKILQGSQRYTWFLSRDGFSLVQPPTTEPSTDPNGGGGGSSQNGGNGASSSSESGSCDGCGFFTVKRTFQQHCVKFMVGNLIVLTVLVVVVLAALVMLRRPVRRCLCDDKDDDIHRNENDRRREPESFEAQAPYYTAVEMQKKAAPTQRTTPSSTTPGTTPPVTNLQPPPQAAQGQPHPVRPLSQRELADYMAAHQRQNDLLYRQQLQQEQEEYAQWLQEQEQQQMAHSMPNTSPYGNEDSYGPGHEMGCGSAPPNRGPYPYHAFQGAQHSSYSDPSTGITPQQMIIEEVVETASERAHKHAQRAHTRQNGNRKNPTQPQPQQRRRTQPKEEEFEDVVPLEQRPRGQPQPPPAKRSPKNYTTNLDDIDEDDGDVYMGGGPDGNTFEDANPEPATARANPSPSFAREPF